MPRTLNEVAHARRRDEFLDSAQRLIEAKGYLRITIQDVLDDLGTSKGALYHYFDSKEALYEGLVERAVDVVEASLVRNTKDSELSALEKLREFCAAKVQQGLEARDFWLAALPFLYSDDNAILRQKVRSRVRDRIAPLLAQIVAQGVHEGVFTAPYPDVTGRVVMGLLNDGGEAFVELLSARPAGGEDFRLAERTLAAYTDALERVLGAPRGSLVLLDAAQLQEWFGSGRARSTSSVRTQQLEGEPNDEVR